MSAAPARHPRPIPASARPTARAASPRAASPRAGAAYASGTAARASSARASAAPATRSQPGRRAGAPSQAPRTHLRAVQAPEQARSLVPFAWLCAAIIVGALSSVLFLNTSMASGAYERRDLKIEIANLHEQRATLVTKLEQQSAPAQLGQDARRLGMVPAEQFGFLSLADSVVIESGDK